MATYTSQYPPAHNADHVKASSVYGATFQPYFATDPSRPVVGVSSNNAWVSASGLFTNQKFSVDLGTDAIVRRLYFENYHYSGSYTNNGSKTVTVYGTNSAAAFANTDYSDLTDLVELDTFDIPPHVASNVADPFYYELSSNATAYRYYVLRIASNNGGSSFIAFRRVEFQTEDGYVPGGGGGATIKHRAAVDMPYSISAEMRAKVDMLYSLRNLAFVTMLYGDCPEKRGMIDMPYSDCPVLRAKLDMEYGDLLMLRTKQDMVYSMPGELRSYQDMIYCLAGDPVRAFVEMDYELRENDALRVKVDFVYALLAELSPKKIEVALTIGGRKVNAHHLSVEPDISEYAIGCELHVSKLDWLAIEDKEPVVVWLKKGDEEVTFNLLVELTRRSRNEVASTTYIVQALSPAMLLTAPWCRPFTKQYDAGTAHAIIDEIVGDLGPVIWQIDDFPVLAGSLYANDEDKLTVIRKLLASVGAIFQSDPDGSIRICYAGPDDLEKAEPEYFFTDHKNFISQDESPVHTSGYNKYLVGNQTTPEQREWAEQREVTGNVKEVLVFQTPWDEARPYELRHSGGDWVYPPEYMGVVEELYPPEDEPAEQVEFVAGFASTSRPIYSRPEVEWVREQLGAITYSEDGQLEAEYKTGRTEGYSLAELRYVTKYHLWRVRDDLSEDVQFFVKLLEVA